MTSIKHNFTILNSFDDPFSGFFFEVSHGTGNFVVYGMLFTIFIISNYVMLKKTNDIAKSSIMSMHLITMLSLLLYYAGKTAGIGLISDVVMLGVVVIESLAIAGIYYQRSNQD